TVKMKGMVRDVSDKGLVVPSASDVKWRVTEAFGDRVFGEGTGELSRDGGWEAEWKIPENSKLGRLQIRCAIGGQQYDGVPEIAVEEYRVPLFSVIVGADSEVGDTAHAKVSSAYFHGAPNATARVHWKATWNASGDFGSETDGYKKRFNAIADVGPSLDLVNELTKTIEGDAQLDEHGFATIACASPFRENAAVVRADVSWRADVTSVDGQTIVGGVTETVFPNSVRLGTKAIERTGDNPGIDVAVDAIDKENDQVNDVSVHAD